MVTNDNDDDKSTLVTITAYDVGTYRVHIEYILQCSNRTAGSELRRAIDQPFLLDVSSVRRGRGGRPAGFPTKPCTDFRWRHGKWMECHTTPLACMRTGWVWVPNDCFFPVLTADEIANPPRPTWVLFAGSSVERGSFLSLVDHVLGPRAANLTISDFWKCWGWMDLKVGNVRISYLDFGTERVFAGGLDPTYLVQAILALNDLGRADGLGPDVFHLEMTDSYGRSMQGEGTLKANDFVHAVKAWLGDQWRGRFIVSWGKTPAFSPQRYQKPPLYEWIEKNVTTGVDYVYESHMAAPAMHDTEFSLTGKHWSQHYHRKCAHGGMHVCSVVCDAAAQQILSLAFRQTASDPGIKLPWQREAPQDAQRDRDLPAPSLSTSSSKTPDSEEIMFCLNCPPSLVPFTIKAWRRESGTDAIRFFQRRGADVNHYHQ